MSSKLEHVKIREATAKDAQDVAELITRLKKLNSEFDPLLKTNAQLAKETRKYIDDTLKSDSFVLLVADHKGKIIATVKGEIKDRIFYEPRIEGAIDEFYVLPEFRRTALGKQMLSKVAEKMKAKGAQIITAEFPSQNRIASSFYEKLGFRAIINIYAKVY
ncbi:MAG: GNAT family N-acetyltransferase [Candidatus Bathyarchaeia archaeon]